MAAVTDYAEKLRLIRIKIDMNTFLECFDISDDKIRRMVSKRLEHFGVRVQRSVFEVSFHSIDELNALKIIINDWIEDCDDVRFYALCLACRSLSHTVDDKRVAEFPASVVV